jgi:serine protease inhibitor
MSHTLTDDEFDATVELHYHVQEMFETQNTIIGMDQKNEIIALRYNGDQQEVADVIKYVGAVEAFLAYAANYPDILARTLALLKGVDGVVVDDLPAANAVVAPAATAEGGSGWQQPERKYPVERGDEDHSW